MEEQTDDVSGRKQTTDRIVRGVEHLRLRVDLQAAEREGDAARHCVRPVRRFIDGVGPVGFLGRDAFRAPAV